MTRDDTAWISDLFASCARDWTPASARNEACVLYAPVRARSGGIEALRDQCCPKANDGARNAL